MPLIPNETPVDDLVTVNLSTPGEFVKLKPKWSKGDGLKVSRIVFEGHKYGTSLDAGLYVERSELAPLVVMIREWNLTDADASIAPITMETVAQLPDEDCDIIKAAATELYRARTKEESENLPGPGVPTSEERAAIPVSSNGL